MISNHSPAEHADAMERLAGELTADLALPHEHDAVLPAGLAALVMAEGERIVGVAEARVLPLRPSRAGWSPRAGWLLAAAAAVAWLVVPSPFAIRAAAPAVMTAAALRDSLLVDARALKVTWAPSTDPAGAAATGDVIWDAQLQQGVMRFAGLAPNDPRTAQYQLWIIDAERDARYPVDGGVFDVSSTGEVLVPIHARLPVGRPTLFAVTLERPGGVVVSSRERLVLAAPVES